MIFVESRFYKAINGGIGLAAILLASIFFITVIVIYLIRTCQTRKNLFNNLSSHLTGDARSTPAKFLRAAVFLLLTGGFAAVIYYNINKMMTDDPIVTVKVEKNEESPSILFCSPTPVEISKATYFENLDNFSNETLAANLINSFNNIIMGKEHERSCMLFNSTLSTKPKEMIGGVYVFGLFNEGVEIDIFIGDFNDIDKSRSFPQGSVHSNIGTQVINSTPTIILTYEETKYKDLDGGKIHRSYQFSLIGTEPSTGAAEFVNMIIIAPNDVIVNEEEPPLDLAAFFGNIGGYLTICGIFGFLFGNGKMNPFGFVTQYCFQYKDLDKDIETANCLEEGNDDNSEKDIIEKDNESKFMNMLKKYYVDMDLK
jgi:hypothetical protein